MEPRPLKCTRFTLWTKSRTYALTWDNLDEVLVPQRLSAPCGCCSYNQAEPRVWRTREVMFDTARVTCADYLAIYAPSRLRGGGGPCRCGGLPMRACRPRRSAMSTSRVKES